MGLGTDERSAKSVLPPTNQLAEMLRTLGYSRLVSIDNFRQPNFPLVAEVRTPS